MNIKHPSTKGQELARMSWFSPQQLYRGRQFTLGPGAVLIKSVTTTTYKLVVSCASSSSVLALDLLWERAVFKSSWLIWCSCSQAWVYASCRVLMMSKWYRRSYLDPRTRSRILLHGVCRRWSRIRLLTDSWVKKVWSSVRERKRWRAMRWLGHLKENRLSICWPSASKVE